MIVHVESHVGQQAQRVLQKATLTRTKSTEALIRHFRCEASRGRIGLSSRLWL
jgi:hypothetical protein